MAPLPKKKHTKSRTGKRRSKIRLAVPTLVPCPSCKKLKIPHRVCPHCNFYKKTNESKD